MIKLRVDLELSLDQFDELVRVGILNGGGLREDPRKRATEHELKTDARYAVKLVVEEAVRTRPSRQPV